MVLPFLLMLSARRHDAMMQVVAGGLVIVALFVIGGLTGLFLPPIHHSAKNDGEST